MYRTIVTDNLNHVIINLLRSFLVTGGACSHAKAFDYFALSILARKECKALQCTNWSDYEAGECGEFAKSTYMGEHVDKKYVSFFDFPKEILSIMI